MFSYGGLVFKDYVYEPGMVADLPDIYNSLFSKQQAKVPAGNYRSSSNFYVYMLSKAIRRT